MTPALTKFFPRTNTNNPGALPHHRRHPTCPISRCPAIITTTWPTSPLTPHRGHFSGNSSSYAQNLGQIRTHYKLPRIPLRIVELCEGLATGVEALLRNGYAISS